MWDNSYHMNPKRTEHQKLALVFRYYQKFEMRVSSTDSKIKKNIPNPITQEVTKTNY